MRIVETGNNPELQAVDSSALVAPGCDNHSPRSAKGLLSLRGWGVYRFSLTQVYDPLCKHYAKATDLPTLTILNLPLEGFRKGISYSSRCCDKTPYRSSSREKGVVWLTVCRPSRSWQNPGVNLGAAGYIVCILGAAGYIVSTVSVLLTLYCLDKHCGQRHLSKKALIGLDSFRGLEFMIEGQKPGRKSQSSHLHEQDADRSSPRVMESFETANPIPSDTSSNKTTNHNPFQIVPSTESKHLKLWAYGAIFLQNITARKHREMSSLSPLYYCYVV